MSKGKHKRAVEGEDSSSSNIDETSNKGVTESPAKKLMTSPGEGVASSSPGVKNAVDNSATEVMGSFATDIMGSPIRKLRSSPEAKKADGNYVTNATDVDMSPLGRAVGKASISDGNAITSSSSSTRQNIFNSSMAMEAAATAVTQVEDIDNGPIINDLTILGRRLSKIGAKGLTDACDPLPVNCYRAIGLATAEYSKHNRTQTVKFNKENNTISTFSLQGNRSTDTDGDDVVEENFKLLINIVIDSAKGYAKKSSEFAALAYLFYKLNTMQHGDCNQTNAKTFATDLEFFDPNKRIVETDNYHFRDKVGKKGSNEREDFEDSSTPRSGGKTTPGKSSKSTPGSSGKKTNGRGGGSMF